MLLRFTDGHAIAPAGEVVPGLALIAPTAVATLAPVTRAQLVACAGRGSALVFTAEELFAPGFAARGGDARWIADSLEVPFEWWRVLDDAGVERFTAWFYAADCGLVFVAGTTTVCAQAIQSGSAWEVEGPWAADIPVRIAFARAHREVISAQPGTGAAGCYPLDDDPALVTA